MMINYLYKRIVAIDGTLRISAWCAHHNTAWFGWCDVVEVDAEAWATLEGDYKLSNWEDDVSYEIRRMGVNDWEIDCEWDVVDLVRIDVDSMVLEGEGEDEQPIYEEA